MSENLGFAQNPQAFQVDPFDQIRAFDVQDRDYPSGEHYCCALAFWWINRRVTN